MPTFSRFRCSISRYAFFLCALLAFGLAGCGEEPTATISNEVDGEEDSFGSASDDSAVESLGSMNTTGYNPKSCSACESRVTQLSLLYTGDSAASIKAVQTPDGVVLFDGALSQGESFGFSTGTMGAGIALLVDGVKTAAMATDCSEAVGPGYSDGPFEVLFAADLDGGSLCSVSQDYVVVEGCRIDGIFYEAGQTNPDTLCLICDPDRNTDAWSDNDGASCDDGNYCNGADSCLTGECADHQGDPCVDDGVYCNGAEVCVEQYDQCWHTGDPCWNDGLFCNGSESCNEETNTCDHTGDPCENDGLYCNGEEFCDEANDVCGSAGSPCDDGLFCNGVETCNEENNECVSPGDPCADDGEFCNGSEVCVEQYDQCWHTGDPCGNDGLYCNGAESCNEAADTCDHTGDPCGDDGLFCNGTESCNEQNDQCQSAGNPCGNDGEFCTGVEVCDEEGDACVNTGTPCPDDGIFCNGEEICMEEFQQCWHSGNPCPIDDMFCNGTESCDESAGACAATEPPCADDGLFCNGTESCDEEGDACVSSEEPCEDDGLYCNGAEVCDEENDVCDHENEPCPDNGLFCDGAETCDEETNECWSTGFPCLEGQECYEEMDECSGQMVLILFDDYGGSWNYGKLFANMTANLVNHYGFDYRFLDAEDYQAGDLGGFDYAVYIGTLYAEPISPALLQDISDRVAPVFWVNYNLWQIAWNSAYNSDWGFDFIYSVADSDYTAVEYRGESFSKHEYYPEFNLVDVTDESKAEVKAWLINPSNTADRAPYIVKGDGLWYCADNPYAWLWDSSRYVVFSDQLGEFLGYTPHFGKRAMVRFEDNAPMVSDNKKLLKVGQALKNLNVPFGIALIPRFVDPTGEYFEEPVDYGLTDDPNFVSTILQLQNLGGTILLHGYTHQYDGATGDDWEFWLEDANTSVPEDSAAWAQARLDAALAECHAQGIYPTVWETPHYSASQVDYEVFYQNFDTSYERIRIFNNFNSNPQALLRESDSSKALATGNVMEYPLIIGAESMSLAQIRSREVLSAGVMNPSSRNAATAGADEDAFTLQFVNFGVPSTIYGSMWIPENMGYIDPGIVTPTDLLAVSRRYAVLNDPVSSFFYHHDYSLNDLLATVNGMIDQGYEFVSVQEMKDSMTNP